MKLDKVYRISLFVIACILINYVGKDLAECNEWPVWLDSVGTICAAYGLGPVCGAIVGFTGNVIYGLMNEFSIYYASINILIGVIVGILAKKQLFNSRYGTVGMAMVVTFVTVLCSLPLNIVLYHGMTGNKWGDGVIGFLSEHNLNKYVAYTIGEFYMDFLDKFISMYIMYFFLRIVRYIRSEVISDDMNQEDDSRGQDYIKKDDTKSSDSKIHAGIFVLLAGLLSISSLDGIYAYAKEEDEVNYNAFIQRTYDGDNGLVCGEANDIEQTNDGILWIGTYAGLYRYNGNEFRWINEHESIKNVNCLFKDEEGRLWVGTNDSGLSVLVNNKVVNVVDEHTGLPSYSVRSVVQCSDGDYYVGTSDSLAIMSLNGGLRIVSVVDEVKYACSASNDQKGNVAVVTAEGTLYIFNQQKVTMSMKATENEEIFSCCSFDEAGCLYVGTTTNHVYVYDISNGTFAEVKKYECEGLSNINEVFFLENKDIMLCSDSGVGYINKSGKYTAINTGNFNNSIDHMEVDYQGNIWFTSSRMGLMSMSKSFFTNIYNEVGIRNAVANSVTIKDSYMYVGTDVGLDIIDLKNNKEVKNSITQDLEGYRIRCVIKDSENQIWICTYGKGIVKYNSDGEIKSFATEEGLFGNRCRSVKQLSNGQIVVAGDAGVSIIENDTVIKTLTSEDGISNSLVLCVAEGNDGEIFLGTDGAGINIIEKDGTLSYISRNDGLSSGVILRIVSDKNGQGYFIVSSNGINYMDNDRKIRQLDNFPYFNNYDIWENENGALFVNSSAGIYVVDKQTLMSGKEEVEYNLLNAEKGLESSLVANSWNYLDEQGNLYICCDTGVYMFNMQQYYTGNKSYRMLISEVKVDNISYKIEREEEFEINRGAKKIEIFPEIINYSIGDPYIRYYLEGFDNEPVVVQRSQLKSIIYTNIPTGTYRFVIEVIDSKQQDIMEKSTYVFVKEKEIYDGSGFKLYMIIVAALAVIVGTWLVTKYRIQKLLSIQEKELEFARKQVQMGDETIMAIARTVDAKDENTSQHSLRVAEYSVMIGQEYGLDDKECENLRRAAMLHDIGKIGIPDNVLNKPSRLNDEEYNIMKSHVIKGAEILKGFTLVEHVVDGALYHHERYDGKGYASGLSGEDIPVYGRIIGVADAFDAMTANRVYRKQLDFEYVIGELEKGKGTQFDPVFIDILLGLIETGKIDVNSLYNRRTEGM